jgi:hypothetical protein
VLYLKHLLEPKKSTEIWLHVTNTEIVLQRLTRFYDCIDRFLLHSYCFRRMSLRFEAHNLHLQFTEEQLAYQRKIFDEILVRMGLHDLSGWYRMTDDDLFRREGAHVLTQFGALSLSLTWLL